MQKLKRMWPEPPGLDEHGKYFWRTTGKVLLKHGVLTELDREAFISLCEAYSMKRRAEALLAAEGLTAPDREGSAKKHPAFTIWAKAADNYHKLLDRFGLNPKARQEKIRTQGVVKNEKARFFQE
ncbi:MAG: phage terminase small subunit P27 family [Syntrophomonadaceae bacterium]|nr:phage terminase small subunit P27 family [Syntrophomonadaceae bacterium]